MLNVNTSEGIIHRQYDIFIADHKNGFVGGIRVMPDGSRCFEGDVEKTVQVFRVQLESLPKFVEVGGKE